MTERQARELKMLPSAERLEVARSVDFAEVSVRDLKRIIREGKETACVERKIECETPPPDLLASTRAVAFARRGSGRAPYRRLTYRAGVDFCLLPALGGYGVAWRWLAGELGAREKARRRCRALRGMGQ